MPSSSIEAYRRRGTFGRRRRRGAALVELAVTLPVWLLVITGILFFGRLCSDKLELHAAARYAAWHTANARLGQSALQVAQGRSLHISSQGDFRVDGSAVECTETLEQRLLGASSPCSDGGSEAIPPSPQPGFFAGLLADVGLSFAIRSAHVELDRQTDFLGPGGVELDETVWLHDNYVPGSAATDPNEVFDDVDLGL